MRGLDIFVSAARTESFGLVIIEAMASGTAVLATETEGASEILRDGETGKLVPLDNPIRLADAIVEILGDEKIRGDFCRNAQAEAKAKFNLKRMIVETEEIYNEVLLIDKSK
jgi:glycosyltransferase involved in cell wall biosynthesis